MDIRVENLGKKYGKEWIFRHLDIEIPTGTKIAIIGSNGSGKSTLLKILSNFLTPSEGKVSYGATKSRIEDPNLQFTLIGPYLQLIHELTVKEFLEFHQHFRKSPFTTEDLLEKCHLGTAENRMVAELSSGMMQRLKLAIGFFFDNEIIFLDEPTTNLDAKGIAWYEAMISLSAKDQTVIIASNQESEYKMCSQLIEIEKFKPIGSS